MLKIYIPDYLDPPSDVEIISDVEEGFTRILGGIPDDDTVRNLIRTIEHGEYVDKVSFKDRFGKVLYMECLSTGCKAALCVHCLVDCIVSTMECGSNAITAMIWYCNNGNIELDYDYHGLASLDAPEIDVVVDKYHFSSAQSLVSYLEDIFPDEPPHGMEGVTHVSDT